MGREIYIDRALDDLHSHAKGEPCRRPLAAVALDIIEWFQGAIKDKRIADGLQYYIDDLQTDRSALPKP